MDNIYEELEKIFQNFRWIDDIPEDQFRRDEICLEARAALLIEANCTSERFPAFVRNAVKQFAEKNYQLPEAITIQHEIDSCNGTMAYLTCSIFEPGKLNYSGKYWGPVMSHTTDYAKREIPQRSPYKPMLHLLYPGLLYQGFFHILPMLEKVADSFLKSLQLMFSTPAI